MTALLADVESASGSVVIPAWAMVSALLSVVAAFIALGRMLLNEKDAKLALAREVGKDYSTDREKTNAILIDLGAKVTRVAEGLETALDERDKIVADGMDLLRDVKADLIELKGDIDRLLRERAP